MEWPHDFGLYEMHAKRIRNETKEDSKVMRYKQLPDKNALHESPTTLSN